MSHPIQTLAVRLTAGLDGQRARAVALHDFVRDRIAFGFTPRLDAATPEETLAAGVGHTIPKTALFVALLRALGLRAFQHFVTIDHEILRGVFPHGVHRLLPWEIPHCYAEVEIDDDWWRVDSYALDAPLWRAATARLARDGDLLGYGAHAFGTCCWNGAGNAFAQLAMPEMMVEDHGPFEDARAFLSGHAHGAGDIGRAWSGFFSLANPVVAAASTQRTNDRLEALRALAPVLAAGRA